MPGAGLAGNDIDIDPLVLKLEIAHEQLDLVAVPGTTVAINSIHLKPLVDY
jgi:hypothetical protein